MFGSSDLDELLRGDRVGETALRCRHSSIQGKRGGKLAERIVEWIEQRMAAAHAEANGQGVGANVHGTAAGEKRAKVALGTAGQARSRAGGGKAALVDN